MKKFLIAALVLLVGLLAVRFILGGDEDGWICSDGSWVKHGSPNSPAPDTGCGETNNEWQTQSMDEIGITFKHPKDTTFRKEIADDAGKIRVASFYIEKGEAENPTYMLYAVYQPSETATEKELDRIKTGLSPGTAKEITIDGYKGIEGLTVISGPKNHYVSAIVKDGHLFTVSTFPVTEEAKQLTNKIIATFDFK